MGDTDFISSFIIKEAEQSENKYEAMALLLGELLTNYKSEWDRAFPDLGKGIIETEDELIEVMIKTVRKLEAFYR